MNSSLYVQKRTDKRMYQRMRHYIFILLRKHIITQTDFMQYGVYLRKLEPGFKEDKQTNEIHKHFSSSLEVYKKFFITSKSATKFENNKKHI